jgi:glycosyltransferase involved in cell wall biosynthesis
MHVYSSSPWDRVRAFVFDDAHGNRYAAGRTLRAFGWRGIRIENICGEAPEKLADIFSKTPGSILLLRAGTWPVDVERISLPPPSATGRPLFALGAVRPENTFGAAPHETVTQWTALHARTGGNFAQRDDSIRHLPPVAIGYLESPLVESLTRRLAGGETLDGALRAELGSPNRRVVHCGPLDVHFDPALRIVQLVTSLQQGGAERIALELHRTLGQYDIRSLLIGLGSPTRAAFPTPPAAVDLSRVGPGRRERIAAAARVALDFAADLVHGHLLHGEDVAQITALGLPVVLTVHNMPPGWPNDLTALQSRDASLLVACSQAVEAELQKAKIPIPARTVWNGIDFAPFEQTAALGEAGHAMRRQLGIPDGDFVLLALANPRPQKRLELLPPILAAAQDEFAERGNARQLHLIIAGEPSRIDQSAALCESAVQAAITECGLADRIHRIGAVGDVATLMAAGNILISTSAYEGLSLAHLEALAAGLPIVATAVGGVVEVARQNPAMFLLPADAGPKQFASVLADLVEAPPASGRAAAEIHFTRYRMAKGYRRFYPRAIEASSRRKSSSGLWLISNNFSMGGAQSSARRLLLGMVAKGIRVRSAVLEEQAEYPTPGRKALLAANIPVLALPPAGSIDPAEAVAMLLKCMDEDPPETVIFWNAITQYKLLLADSLLDVPVFDVSPGEMYFSSLEKYFENPRPGLPYRTAREYGARLSGVIVKFQAEAAQAAEWLGAPVHVVPNGVPLDPCAGDRPPGDHLVIGTAARISPQKKLEEMFHAFRKADGCMPPYELHIAGGVERGADDYARRLREEAAGLPVKFLGELEDPRPFYRSLDLFVMISEPAGCPNASLEAMAGGLPVVATDVGGASEQIADGVTGRLVPRGDPTALTDALVALACNPELRSRYGKAGRARIAALFEVNRMVEDYCRILFSRNPR